MRKILLALAFLGACISAHAQGSRYQNIVLDGTGHPVGGATIRVCTQPSTGQPCSPLASIYANTALTTPLPNPTASDGLGNYFFYVTPGTYTIEIAGPGLVDTIYPDQVVGGAGQGVPFPGPNPWYDPTNTTFNGGASGSSQQTTGTISSGSAALTLAAAKDFKNGQGIAVFGAGPTSTLAAPTGLSGSQTRRVANIASNGTVAATAASFGTNGITCTGGVATVTTWGYHGFATGQSVTIAGTADYNGTYTITVTNPYTFTVSATCVTTDQGGTATLNAGSTTFNYKIVAEDANSGYGPASANIAVTSADALSLGVGNSLGWSAVTGATQYLVYGDGGLGGALTCVGVANAVTSPTGLTPTFTDYGRAHTCPSNAPTNPPASATAGIFITTISSGAGTTSLTLGATASNAATGQTIIHDDTGAINAAISAACNNTATLTGGGATVRIPLGIYFFQTLTLCQPVQGFHAPMILEFSGELVPRQPIVVQYPNWTIRGLGGGQQTSFGASGLGLINGSVGTPAPVFRMTSQVANLSDEKIESTAILYCSETCLSIEGNAPGTVLNNVSMANDSLSPKSPFYAYSTSNGMFGLTLNGGSASTGTLPTYVGSMDLTNVSGLTFNGATMVNSGAVMHVIGGQVLLNENFLGHQGLALYENVMSPFLTLNAVSGAFEGVTLDGASTADPVNGADIAMVKTDGSVYGLAVKNSSGVLSTFIEGSGMASMNGYSFICAVNSSSCTYGTANGYQFPAYGGDTVDNLGTHTLIQGANNQPLFHLIGHTTSSILFDIPASLGSATKNFSLDSSGNLSASTLTSTATTGTAPLTVTSTTNVPNLNASSLNGATFAAPGPIGGTTPGTSVFTAVTSGGTINVSGSGACGTIINGTGGNWAGTVQCTGTTGASTLVITPRITAPNGFSCWANDITTANILRQSAVSTTTCTIAGTVNANDVLTFGAIAY